VKGIPVSANSVPYYSVHGIGFQANYILPAKDFLVFFKYYDQYSAKARVQGRTIAFGVRGRGRLQNRRPLRSRKAPVNWATLLLAGQRPLALPARYNSTNYY